MLVVTTHHWGKKYDPSYVRKLRAAVKRNLRREHRFVLVAEDPSLFPDLDVMRLRDPALTKIRGCTCRLRMFDPQWQRDAEILPGDEIVSLDLDAVVTGELDPLLGRDENFTILQGINSTNPCPYNGSIWRFRAGSRADVWRDYSPEANSLVKFHAFPDDQGWFWHKIPDAGAWGPSDGVYGFKKLGWPSGDSLPEGARLVAFPGWRDPVTFGHIDWVQKHWRI